MLLLWLAYTAMYDLEAFLFHIKVLIAARLVLKC